VALVEVNWRPSPKELRFFAVLFLLFAGIVAWFLKSRFEAPSAGVWVLVVAGAVAGLGLVLPKLIWPLYVVWMAAALPIGWTVSHVVMALVFYLVFTPIGLIMRFCGRDPMERRLDNEAGSYWKERNTRIETRRYFRQF
jgi:hypothetical protein